MGTFVLLFGEFHLNPWGIAHKVLRQREHIENMHTFLIDDYNSILPERQLLELLDGRSNLTISQDERIKLSEHEIFEIKNVIKQYLLDVPSLKKK